jgi:uncharacterized protein (DUF1778 family)
MRRRQRAGKENRVPRAISFAPAELDQIDRAAEVLDLTRSGFVSKVAAKEAARVLEVEQRRAERQAQVA